MIDITQAEVNAFVLKALASMCTGGWLTIVGILIWGSFKDKTAGERSKSRQWLVGILLVTFACAAFIWYMTLPATRGAQ